MYSYLKPFCCINNVHENDEAKMEIGCLARVNRGRAYRNFDVHIVS